MTRCESSRRIGCPVQWLEPRCLLSQTVITGVLPVSLDQPQIHALFRRDLTSDPLQASDGMGGTVFDVQAYFDTGTSGMLLSQETAYALGISHQVQDGVPVVYYDVGVAGLEGFDVSEPLYVSLAPFGVEVNVDDLSVWPSVYTQTTGPVRTQIAQLPADELIGPLDILGMPLFANKVVVMDATPINDLGNMKTYVYNPGTAFRPATVTTDPGIPAVSNHVKLSFASFDRFGLLDPPTAARPSTHGNPFIGPDPVRRMEDPTFDDGTPPVTISFGGEATTGSFLLDTGAAASFLSRAKAAEVGVQYLEGTYNTDNPTLVDAYGNELPNQFALAVGGVGGSVSVAGFFLDELLLQTVEGNQIAFDGAPVLVVDVSVEDPETGEILTLDGDIGMNYLVASAMVVGGWPTSIHAGGFDWITIDEPNGLMGLEPTTLIQPAPVITAIAPDTGSSSTDGITSSRAPTISGNAEPDVHVTVYRDGIELGTTQADGNGAWSLPASGPPMADGQYSYTAIASDPVTGPSALSAAYVVIVDGTPPAAPSLVISAGAAQRSMVTSMTLTFAEPVALSSNAIVLSLRSGASPSGVTLNVTNPSSDGRTYTLTFTGSAVVGGSLPDGVYDLTVQAAGVQDRAGNALSANFTRRFHRLFGDSNGDAVVNLIDYTRLRLTLGRSSGDPLYNPIFDRDGNGTVNVTDLAQFRRRFGQRYTY